MHRSDTTETDNGGPVLRQTASNGGLSDALAAASRTHSASAPTLPLGRLWREAEAAAYFGVKSRTFANMRAAGLVPEPLVLGPRCLRWVPAECEAAALALPRKRLDGNMPPQLAAGRAKSKAGAATGGTDGRA